MNARLQPTTAGLRRVDYGKFADTGLRDVPPVFEAYKDRLPDNFRKRAAHYFGEYRRAEEGAEAWRKGDLDTYGKLIFESGKSSIENYECGCPELISLYNIMTETDGIYGGRFSGAGFKGCCMALVDPEKAQDIMASVEEKYLKEYPNLREIPRRAVRLCGQRQPVMQCAVRSGVQAVICRQQRESEPAQRGA